MLFKARLPPALLGSNPMKKTVAGIFVFVVLCGVLAAGSLTYHLYKASPVELIVYMQPDDSSGVLRWSARHAFYAFHPTPAEAAQLSAEAGARYAATFPVPQQAEALLKHMIRNGVDINSVDRASGSGLTALHAVALRGDAQAVKLLLDAGANPDAKDSAGRTPLQLIRKAQANGSKTRFAEVERELSAANS